MYVVATAGHVDHGKSTLIRALTGMEPDRWAEERRRGMTLDLGYAWTHLPSGAVVAFVDVPGHARFIGNMLAGVGPAPAVLFVVAADEGWRQQSTEHLAAVTALGITAGLLAVTRSDLADPRPALAQARRHLADSPLAEVEGVVVSGSTGYGLVELRQALDRLVARLPASDPSGRVRLWVDRAFTVKGSGTVVTGTLEAGTLHQGGALELGDLPIRVRGLQSLGTARESVAAVARVAVNVRGVDRDQIRRGDALLTPRSWHLTDRLDVRLSTTSVPPELMLHIGTATLPVRVRPLGDGLARLTLPKALPVQAGDRAVLRDPGQQQIAGGVLVLDADPPELRRRGAAAVRAAQLSTGQGRPELRTEVARRGIVARAEILALGIEVVEVPGVQERGEWLVDEPTWLAWVAALPALVEDYLSQHPLEPGLPASIAQQQMGIPDLRMLAGLAKSAGLEQHHGRLRRPGTAPSLGTTVGPAVEAVTQRLLGKPFEAPEQADLDELGLGRRELAAAAAAGRLLLLGANVVLLPDAPARAMAALAELSQPFTVSAARRALASTRRVVIPLLEHLDGRGWTRRLEGGLRQVVR